MYRFNIAPARLAFRRTRCWTREHRHGRDGCSEGVRRIESNLENLSMRLESLWILVGDPFRQWVCVWRIYVRRFKCSGTERSCTRTKEKLKYKHFNSARRQSNVRILVCWTTKKKKERKWATVNCVRICEIAVTINYNHSSVARWGKNIYALTHTSQLNTHNIYQLNIDSTAHNWIVHESRRNLSSRAVCHKSISSTVVASGTIHSFGHMIDKRQSADSASNQYLRVYCCVSRLTSIVMHQFETRFAPKFQWYRFHINNAMINRRTMCAHCEWDSYAKRNAHAEQDRNFRRTGLMRLAIWSFWAINWMSWTFSQGCLRSPSNGRIHVYTVGRETGLRLEKA